MSPRNGRGELWWAGDGELRVLRPLALVALVLMLAVPGWAAPSGASAAPSRVRKEAPRAEPTRLPMTLQQALRTALDNSPRLAEYRSKIRQAGYKVDQAYTQINPTLDFSAGYDRITPTVEFPIPGGPSYSIIQENNYKVALTLRQAVLTFGRLKWSTLAAKLQRKSARENYREQAEALIEQVRVDFHQLLLAHQGVKIALDRVAAQRAQLKVSHELYKAGVAARFDILRNRAELSTAQQQLLEARNQVKLARATLRSDLGLAPDYPLRVVPTGLPGPPPAHWRQARGRALQRRPELTALEWAVKAARARVNLETSQNNPRLDFQSEATEVNSTAFTSGEQWTTGLTLSVPIFDGGLSKALENQAEESMHQLRDQLEQMRRDVVLQVQQAHLDMVNAWQQIDVAKRGLEEQTEALRVGRLRYREGISTNVELLETQTAYSQAQYSLAQARFDYQKSWAAWQRAISGEYPVEIPGLTPTATRGASKDSSHRKRKR